jgi:hypothetical protein
MNLPASEIDLAAAPFVPIATGERTYFWRQDDPIPDGAPPQFPIATFKGSRAKAGPALR